MINKERFSEVPHYELIQENEIIHIPSVFMFKGGHEPILTEKVVQDL